ncbi:MAG TPA: HAD family phosphatase [Bryobacteraceae bacterium]|nr:HAD family phosphatase [Bryobacteraceae bacterium]
MAPGLALIFDLDGVVVDSMPVHRIAWRNYLQSLGIGGEDLLARMHGRRNDDIVMDFLGPSADQEVVRKHGAAKERLYRELMRDGLEERLVPGVRGFLEQAAATPCGLASNAERPNIDFVLDCADLRRYFLVIVDGSQVERPKPAPDIYRLAARKLGVEPRNCIVFEDSPVGIAAARAAGARVVGMLTHEHKFEDVALGVSGFLDPELVRWLSLQRPSPAQRAADVPRPA